MTCLRDRGETALIIATHAFSDDARKVDDDGSGNLWSTAAHACAAATVDEDTERREGTGYASDWLSTGWEGTAQVVRTQTKAHHAHREEWNVELGHSAWRTAKRVDGRYGAQGVPRLKAEWLNARGVMLTRQTTARCGVQGAPKEEQRATEMSNGGRALALHGRDGGCVQQGAAEDYSCANWLSSRQPRVLSPRAGKVTRWPLFTIGR